MTKSTKIAPHKRVFITGANGFIGRALAQRYRLLGAAVCGIDFTADASWNVVAGDVREPGQWRGQLAGVDLVMSSANVVFVWTGSEYEDITSQVGLSGSFVVPEPGTAVS